MEGWKTGPGILTLVNSGGLVGFLFIVWKKLSDLDSRVTDLNQKYDALINKIGGPTKNLFDNMAAKVAAWERLIPALEQATKDGRTGVQHTKREINEVYNTVQDLDSLMQTMLVVLLESKEIKLSDEEKAALAEWQTGYQPPQPAPSRFPPRGGYQQPPPPQQQYRGRGGPAPRGQPRGRGAPQPQRGRSTQRQPPPSRDPYHQPYYEQQETGDGYEEEETGDEDDILGPSRR